MMNDNQFESAISEFLDRTRAMVDRESVEDLAPNVPVDGSGPAITRSLLRLDAETIRRYAATIGDDNPLFTDPAYGKQSPYRSQIAPGPILVHARYPAEHGASRPLGYPLANFIGGVVWEFFDVIRPGMQISTSKTLREVLEPHSVRGTRIFLLVCEVTYYDASKKPLAKAYGTLVQVPMKNMGATRVMPIEALGETLLYDRQPYRYKADEMTDIIAGIEGEQRRGATPLYWEDVSIGEMLPAIHQPPYALPDALSYQSLHHGLVGGHDGGLLARAFTPAYRDHKAGVGFPDYSRVHPVTRWPYTPGDEHEDIHLCGYRGQPLPFDFGIQRGQIPQRLLGNWAGDHGFCRKMSMTMGRPLFHGDALVVQGRVIGKKHVTEAGSNTPHNAVVVAMEGFNQRGESVSRGFATMYLPTRAGGSAVLPEALTAAPGYVPYNVHRSHTWF
jgi:acyl dehydratase